MFECCLTKSVLNHTWCALSVGKLRYCDEHRETLVENDPWDTAEYGFLAMAFWLPDWL